MKKISAVVLLSLILTSFGFSQIEIKFKEFPKERLNGSDLWKFNAKNTGKENLNVVFMLAVTYNDTLLYESAAKEMPVSSGETINVDLKFEDPPLKNWYSNIKKGMIIRENDFLIGDYKICMNAYASNEKKQPDINKSYGNTCVNHTVENYETDAAMEIKAKKPDNGKLYTTDLWNFTTTNKSKSKQNAEVYCKLMFNGQDMFEGTSRPFSIQPGETKDLSYKIGEAVMSRFIMERLRDDILKTGEFPPGEYNLCLTVRSEWSKKEFGSNCIDLTVEKEKNDNK